MERNTKFYQASSSEMFGIAPSPQNEDTLFMPQSPYGISKAFAYWATKMYRTAYNMFAVNGILFNHESPRRRENAVSIKIVRAGVRIKLGLQKKVALGNLEAKRDWGHARDYCYAMWMMMQHPCASDWVIATGENFTIKEFGQKVFNKLGLVFEDYVIFNDIYLRPNEVPDLLGDSSKARKLLGWKPEYNIDTLIDDMLEKVTEQEEAALKGGNKWHVLNKAQ
jgi:GDPmannose 4,6-dehydratase